ncbi:hypothetical protein J6524_18610 [Bradyrhizobium sp. WSM 1738]|nr:hypothetical protein [Bradyrhizobium hereditatis]
MPRNERVLLVTVELNSLTFQRNDLTPENLVATSIFGDGAAALLSGPEGKRRLIGIVNSTSLLYPDTSPGMSLHFGDFGFELVFSERVQSIISELTPLALLPYSRSSLARSRVPRAISFCALNLRRGQTLSPQPRSGRRPRRWNPGLRFRDSGLAFDAERYRPRSTPASPELACSASLLCHVLGIIILGMDLLDSVKIRSSADRHATRLGHRNWRQCMESTTELLAQITSKIIRRDRSRQVSAAERTQA